MDLIKVYFVLVIFIQQQIQGSAAGIKCMQPSQKKLKQIEENIKATDAVSSLHESFFQLDNLRDNIQVPSNFTNKRYFRFSRNNRKCPRNQDAKKMSTCPHYFEMEYDENRIPNTLLQARCKCNKCLTTKPNATGVERGTICKPVYYYTKVARAIDCKNGTYVYDNVWEKVSVGCSCAKRNVGLAGLNFKK